jgi:hypothetical protein
MLKTLLPLALLGLLACQSNSLNKEKNLQTSVSQSEKDCKDYLICDNEDWIVCSHIEENKQVFFLKSRLSKEKIAILDVIQNHKIKLNGQPIDISCGDGKNYDFKINQFYLLTIPSKPSVENLIISRK